MAKNTKDYSSSGVSAQQPSVEKVAAPKLAANEQLDAFGASVMNLIYGRAEYINRFPGGTIDFSADTDNNADARAFFPHTFSEELVMIAQDHFEMTDAQRDRLQRFAIKALQDALTDGLITPDEMKKIKEGMCKEIKTMNLSAKPSSFNDDKTAESPKDVTVKNASAQTDEERQAFEEFRRQNEDPRMHVNLRRPEYGRDSDGYKIVHGVVKPYVDQQITNPLAAQIASGETRRGTYGQLPGKPMSNGGVLVEATTRPFVTNVSLAEIYADAGKDPRDKTLSAAFNPNARQMFPDAQFNLPADLAFDNPSGKKATEFKFPIG